MNMERINNLAQEIQTACYSGKPEVAEAKARDILDLLTMAPHNVIAAGTHITCENGHHIMSAAQDVSLLKPQDVDNNWTDWQQDKPTLGDFLPLHCAKCGSEWMRMSRDKRVQYHMAEGWRP